MDATSFNLILTSENHSPEMKAVTGAVRAASKSGMVDHGINPNNITAASVLVIISVVGLIGNVFVVVAVTLSRRLQTITNVFVVTLGCVDLLTALTLPLQAGAMLGAADDNATYSVVCSVISAMLLVFTGCSSFVLIVIAFNRYFLITQPLQRYRRVFSKRNVCVLLIMTLAYPTSIIIVFTSTGWAVFGLKNCICGVVEGLAFTVVLGITTVFLMVTILFFYIKIFLHIRNHRRKLEHGIESNQMSTASCQLPSDESTGGKQPRWAAES